MKTELTAFSLSLWVSLSPLSAQDMALHHLAQTNIELKNGCSRLATGNAADFYAGACLGYIKSISDLSILMNHTEFERVKGICVPDGASIMDMAYAISKFSHQVTASQTTVLMMIDMFKLAYPCQGFRRAM